MPVRKKTVMRRRRAGEGEGEGMMAYGDGLRACRTTHHRRAKGEGEGEGGRRRNPWVTFLRKMRPQDKPSRESWIQFMQRVRPLYHPITQHRR